MGAFLNRPSRRDRLSWRTSGVFAFGSGLGASDGRFCIVGPSLHSGSLSPIKRPWPECCSCWLIHAILRENAAALTHRKREPAQSIHLLLCRLPLCGERRWQRCFGNPKQGGCKPAEGFGPT